MPKLFLPSNKIWKMNKMFGHWKEKPVGVFKKVDEQTGERNKYNKFLINLTYKNYTNIL